eukprot:CAMPEP_0185723290 /NCGR_PEP_ID=MMETSP1171-20130828/185_1 /TAXON_ID=374046 /ORGANISM="Helicotheca tamensis, Strain CCMP826" /LENGTH=215 /DNA_ID=CAMNT_0028390971 /DNA_START=49 /DNA_END=693 /DNA_ORIENTATION=+
MQSALERIDSTCEMNLPNLEPKVVRFAVPLITSVACRPRTSSHNKRVLFYSRAEIQRFRVEDRREKRTTQTQLSQQKNVTFADTVVTEVHEVPSRESMSAKECSRLYYTGADLRSFMDNYLMSLSLETEDDCISDECEMDCIEAPKQSQVDSVLHGSNVSNNQPRTVCSEERYIVSIGSPTAMKEQDQYTSGYNINACPRAFQENSSSIIEQSRR